MTIHFNPYYDEGAYVDLAGRGGMFFGAKVVGPMGLLSELEGRFGIAGDCDTESQRIVLYVKAMRKALTEDSGIFFRESFQNDEIGTTSQE